MDKFYEQFLFTKKSYSFVFLNILFYITAALFMLYLVAAITLFKVDQFIAAAILGVACFGSLRLKDSGYKEFEYTFTNGNLEIDVIYNKRKRKKIFDEDVKNFDNFGPEGEINIGTDYNKKTYVPWDNNQKRYVILLENKGKQAYYIAPDENMLKLINSCLRRIPRR